MRHKTLDIGLTHYFSVLSVVNFFLLAILLSACTKKDKPLPPDTSPPLVKQIASLDTTKLLISFNESVNPELAAETMNYLITSYETLDVHFVEIDPMKMNCILTTEPQESTFYEIDIRNIEDLNGNKINDTTFTFLGIGVQVDSFPPTLTIIEPIEGDTLYGFEYFAVNAWDNTGVKKVSFFINDSLIETDKDFPYYCILDVRSLGEGEVYTFYATAEDYSANIGSSESLKVFIGYHPPFPYVVLDIIPTEKTLFRADITADGTKLFFVQHFAQGSTQDLMMLNTETNSIEKTIPLYTGGSYFLDVFKNEKVYFTTGGSFAVYDILLSQLVKTVNVGGTPQGIVRSNNEKLYIARRTKEDVLVYSLEGDSIVDSIPLPGNPIALAFDTVHNEVYASISPENLITVIDLEGDSAIAQIPISGFPFEVIFSPDYGTAYVSEPNINSIAVIETSDHSVLDEFSPSNLISPKGMAMTDDGEHLFVTGSSNKVFVVNLFDYSVEWNFELGPNPYSIVFTPSGEKVYVTCQGTQYGGSGIYCIGY